MRWVVIVAAAVEEDGGSGFEEEAGAFLEDSSRRTGAWEVLGGRALLKAVGENEGREFMEGYRYCTRFCNGRIGILASKYLNEVQKPRVS